MYSMELRNEITQHYIIMKVDVLINKGKERKQKYCIRIEQDSASTIENQYNINTCIKAFHTSLLAKYLICIPLLSPSLINFTRCLNNFTILQYYFLSCKQCDIL